MRNLLNPLHCATTAHDDGNKAMTIVIKRVLLVVIAANITGVSVLLYIFN